MARDDVDAVMIASCDHQHTAHLEAAAKAGLHIYVEKPIATEFDKLAAAMHAFGYSYLDDKLDADSRGDLRLQQHSTSAGGGGMFTYEALNFVDGKRTVSDIRDWLIAELGEVPLEYVEEYLAALESIGVINKKNKD